MLRNIYTPTEAKAHLYPKNSKISLFSIKTDLNQRVAILAYRGLKKGTNKAEFCFHVTESFCR